MPSIYHYTTGDRYLGIALAGEIRPAVQNIPPREIPAVWLSTAPVWEHSATKGVIENGKRRLATLDELVGLCGCLVRIRVDPERVRLIHFNQIAEELRIPRLSFLRLRLAGHLMGANPRQWRAVTAAVPASAFLLVEYATSPAHWLEAEATPEDLHRMTA